MASDLAPDTATGNTLATLPAAPLTCSPRTAYWDRENDQDLVCVDVRAETHDVKTFTFRAAEPRAFAFEAGQYFAFDFDIDGQEVSRCYSVSTSALLPHAFSVTVKRVAGGLVSNWLHDHLRPGATVRAWGPGGRFTLGPRAEGPYLFISGGAGITPLMSMLRTLADAHQYPDIVFFHACRSPADVVFGEELRWRARTTPNLRLFLLPENLDGNPGHDGLSGRVSEALLSVAVPDLATRQVLCCGPAPFMRAVRDLSARLGVPAASYFEENFSAADAAAGSSAAVAAAEAIAHAAAPEPAAAATCEPLAAPASTPATAPAALADEAAQQTFQLSLAKQARTIAVASNANLLGAMRQAGLHIPSSCGEGGCGTCKTRLVSGKVDMKHDGGIRQREIDAGFFLPCCSTPLSDLVIDR